MTFSCLCAWALALLLLPALILGLLTESRAERAQRLRRRGLSQQAIAEQMGCSRWRVRQLLGSA